jgi:hypothetical protein
MRKVALVVGLLLSGGVLAQTIPEELLSVLQANPMARSSFWSEQVFSSHPPSQAVRSP